LVPKNSWGSLNETWLVCSLNFFWSWRFFESNLTCLWFENLLVLEVCCRKADLFRVRKPKCFQGSLKENWWIWNLKIEAFLEIGLGFFELFKFDVSMWWRKQDHMHHHNFGSSLNMTLERQFAIGNLLPFLSWWQAFTFCSSTANGDDYLKFDEGEKIFHQSPYLLFFIVISIFWLSFLFFFCQKVQTCDAL
jgi:hypothetical protein